MRNFGGRGNEVTDAENGEFVQWTSSLRSLDTCHLRAFIIKSIHSFIICISTTMCGGAVFAVDGWLVSCRSYLLRALLPSGPSRSLLSVLVPSCSFSWLLGPASLWRSCSSKSWFYLVRHSTATVRVCTCLSRAVVRGSSLLLVAIKRVTTIQLFVREVVVWNLAYFLFSIDGANWWCWKSSVNYTVLMCLRQHLHNTEKENFERVSVWYWPKTLRRLS